MTKDTLPKQLSREDSGFTLLEVLLAMVIMSVMMTITYLSLESILQSKAIIGDEQEVERLELVLARRLAREFQLIRAVGRLPDRANLQPTGSGVAPPPLQAPPLLGEEDSLPNGNPGDSITFVASSVGQNFLDDRVSNSGLVQVSYSLREDPEREKKEDYPVYSLIREEIPHQKPWDQAYQRTVRFPLVDFVEGMKLEYFDYQNEKWTRTWDNNSGGPLPRLIRFTIQVRTPLGKEKLIRGTLPVVGR